MQQILTIRTDTSTYTIQDVKREIEECVSLLAEIGYLDVTKNHYEVDFSTRRVKNFGTCQKIGIEQFKIILNKHYVELASPENVHNTIMHEVIHSVPGCMNHKAPWQAVASKVNRNYNFTKLERLGHDDNYYKTYITNHRRGCLDYKYEVVCDYCEASWKYKKMSKVVQYAPEGKCTCPHCRRKSFTVYTI